MQKIDKTTIILSTRYKTWEEDLETNGKRHPKYTSSNHEFYYDIVMNLFHCQKGLCAYTEVLLCAENLYDARHWENGVFIRTKENASYKGQLEHFDESLKSKKSENGKKDWLWDNFFMAETDANREKGVKKVNPIFKPDNPNYSPDAYLTYDALTHQFKVKEDLSDDLKIEVANMLQVLGINNLTIVNRRAKTLESYFKYGCPHKEFPTAIRFYESKS